MRTSWPERFQLALSLLLLVALPACLASVTDICDPAKPSKYNCLPSCKRPCNTEKRLYQCHYDTTLAILRIGLTPPEGPSLSAFNKSVTALGLLLADDVVLRINPLGLYKGQMEVADYIATFVHPYGLGSRSSVRDLDVVNYVNTGRCYVSQPVADPTQRITNLTLTLFHSFDPVTQKIIKGDWSFLRFPEFQTELSKPDPRVSDTTSATMIRAICGVDASICRPLGYAGYDNVTDCTTFVSSLPRIALYGAQGDNQYCRFVHVAYATVDPKLHCPHISRSGGGVCVDQVYTDYYKVFAPGSFIGKLAGMP